MGKKITLDLDNDVVNLLAILGTSRATSGKRDPQEVIEMLIHHAADGVRRPGSWERNWLVSVFSDDWQEHLEQDETAHWRQRPKREPST
jgi:hypothetical protein